MNKFESLPSTENLDSISIAERHPDWPRLDITFFFAPHGNYADMQQIEPFIKNSDIYLRENLIDDTGTAMYLNTVVSPAMLDEEKTINVSGHKNKSVRGSSTEAVVRGIHGSGTVTGSFDIGSMPGGSELADQITESYRNDLPHRVDFDAAIKFMRSGYARSSELQNKREATMLRNFEDKIERILSENPHLQKGPDGQLNVLISMGVYHTSLRRIFDSAGIKSHSEYTTITGKEKGEAKILYSYGTEAIRSYANGIEPSDDVVARALIENIITTAISEKHPVRHDDITVLEQIEYLRDYVSRLTDDEIHEVYELWNSGEATVENIDKLLVPSGASRLELNTKDMQSFNQARRRGKYAVKSVVKSKSNR